MRKGIKIKYKLSLLLFASIALTLLLAGISLSFFLVQLHTHYARQQIHDAFITLESELKSREAVLLNQSKTMSHREDIISSVNMISEYQFIKDYKAIIFDVEKKKIAVEIAKQAEIAHIGSVAVYDANKMLTAFAVREKEGYRLGIISFRDNRPKAYLSGTGNWDALSESPLPPMIGEINAGHLPKPDTIEYRETSSDFKMEAAFPVVRTLPDGTSKTVGFLKMAYFMGTDFVQDIAKKTSMKFQFFIDGKEGIGIFRDLAFSEQIRQSHSLFSEKQIQKVGRINHDYYFLHSYFIPLEGGTRIYFVLGKEKTLLTAAIRKTKIIMVAAFLLSALIVTLVGVFIADRMISRPVTALVEAVRAFEEGRYEKEIDVKTKNEIGELAAAFNQMTERRKRAEEALRQSETKYHDLYSSAPVAYFSIGTDGLIKSANKAAEDFTGYQSEELLRMKAFDLYAEESEEKAKVLFERFIRGISWENEEMIYERKDGQKIHGLLSVSPIKEENGLILESRSVVVDITERKQVAEELEKHRNHLEEMIGIRTAELDKRISEAEQLNSGMVNLMEDLRVSNDSLATKTQQLTEANKELDAFAYSVSHDLRAPLRAIDGFSQMLVEDYGDKIDGEGQHQLGVIRSSASDMGQLIDDLLAFSRLGRKALMMRHINMGQLTEEVFEKLKLGEIDRKIRLTVDILPPSMGDYSMIREVFANLLSNAMKYTRPMEDPVIEVNARTEGDENIYSVKDNGVGFDMKYTGKLFKVFQRLHSTEEFEGTGIGLALVQRIVHRHGGRVWAEGQVNQGATFYFALPIKEGEGR